MQVEFTQSLWEHTGSMGYNVETIRKDFPILNQSINGKPLNLVR